jgi:hypothetical protein
MRLPICVVIPAYNRAHMLQRSLRSVWAQRPTLPAEVIVVDDGSSDETATVAEKLGARMIRHPQNRGLAAARNTGLHATSHPWVALLDSDDEWLPHHLAHLWELRGNHALVTSSALRCGIDPSRDRFHGTVTRKPIILHSADQLIFPGNIIPVSASMIKREVAVTVGGFQPRWGVEDFDFWLRVLESHTGVCSPRVSVIYHVHDEQMSAQSQRMQEGHLGAAEAHRQRAGTSRVPIKRWEGVAAWDNLRLALASGQRRRATRWGLYITARPSRWRGLIGILRLRYLARRRTTALRAAGLRPPSSLS